MFDTATRNRLSKFVADARRLLCGEYNQPGGEITSLLQTYGIQPDGTMAALDEVPNLDQPGYELGQTLRDLIAHKQATGANLKSWKKYDPHVYDLIQEQGFTILNRLCAVRMAEERGILPYPVVSKGLDSDAFQLYEMVADKQHLDRDQRYRTFLFSIFDELSLDLGVLFDRFSPHSLLFPRPEALRELLAILNHHELAELWSQDETIGWIYQYWNSKDERKAMRDASAAPRNSRELAVRNQFFTPRYVVEFLTDNTLGRIWYEMTKGQTRLAEQCRYLVRRPTEIFLAEGESAPAEDPDHATLSQEELLKQPVHIPHRPLKDPREIRLLDPACGSMHFGLYAFDLFEVIYEEFWDNCIAEGDKSSPDHRSRITDHSHAPLTDLYASKEEYMRDVPKMIIEHNMHGVDIDPRAVQIAGLSLWLRAQRSWQDTPTAARPRVRRSHIVCAEPMPGSDTMLEDFLQKLDSPILAELVRTVFGKMELAGEAGTLLKIEEEIRTAIDEAKAKWEKLGTAERDLFSTEELNQTLRPGAQQELTGIDKALATDHRPLTTDFWDTAEERIYAALRAYAESAEAGDYQRRLFAEDAAHGFAFIDLCRKRYDAVVMNPPFGEASPAIKTYLKKGYKDNAVELYCAFVDRNLSLLESEGFVGCITSSSFVLYTDFSGYREMLLQEQCLEHLANLGESVLDGAYVYTAAYIIRKAPPPNLIQFYDLRFQNDKKAELERLAIDSTDPATRQMPPTKFSSLASSPLCHWASDSLFTLAETAPPLGSMLDDAGVGAAPQADFFDLWWEVPMDSIGFSSRWVRLCNGGSFSPYHRADFLVCDWEDDGKRAIADLNNRYPYLKGNVGIRIQRTHLYGRPGITYGKRTDRFNAQVLPADQIFTFEGIAVFPSNTDPDFVLGVLGYLNSRFAAYYLNLTAGLHKNDVYLRRLPFPFSDDKVYEIGLRVRELIPLVQEALIAEEVHPLHSLGFLVPGSNTTIQDLAASFKSLDRTSEVRLFELLAFIDEAVNTGCSLDEQVLREVNRDQGFDIYTAFNGDSGGASVVRPERERPGFCRFGFEQASDLFRQSFDDLTSPVVIAEHLNSNHLVNEQTLQWFADSLLSCVIGSSFGRWDIRYATGELQPPELPDPFDPLPVCPPGMLQNADGLPASPEDVPDDYPLRISWPGILADDGEHQEDIAQRVRDALTVIWGDRSEAIEQEACEILGVKSLRDYFAEKKSGSKFFKDHLKRYSKSRRQAPIYWPLSTESGTYTLWLYYHRLTPDTLYTCITHFIEPKQKEVERTLITLREKGDARTSADETLYERSNQLVGELATFRSELERLAKIWKPNLNDGVQITAAPLWKLFRLKPWQKKLKDTWTKMEKGDYDWAHLSHTLWPERVIPKCATDRSLAIAHGYESDLWEEVTTNKGKQVWQPKENADETVARLIESL
ncbi:BREX-1 system adenine-specific DNA-methyltransferase PglX [Roseibacillus ishigakijimensis]|uniref:site-specific DNA-methyltransferase (adenine-specific) n=1 Tax=Roseibacillus ishigakijimensis TaxID=454146 RepID=A0A934RVS6_9BACT|nr:BREX-1 system adenine-specific DNA-methyltransferase PglX [Roseibacillus ishigakijimensis]MBK1835065.1 BREX-1 system adenine-specific DNA-methyltransferase PglX [Roseibacillus ishigakijimensis]